MLVNILLFIFVAGFVTTVALGHVLLVAALWPGTPGEPIKARAGEAACGVRQTQ